MNDYMEAERKAVADQLRPGLIGHIFHTDHGWQTYYHSQIHHPNIQGKWVSSPTHDFEMNVADGLVSGWVINGQISESGEYVPTIHIYINGRRINWQKDYTLQNIEEAKKVVVEQLKLQAKATLVDLGEPEMNIDLKELKELIEQATITCHNSVGDQSSLPEAGKVGLLLCGQKMILNAVLAYLEGDETLLLNMAGENKSNGD